MYCKMDFDDPFVRDPAEYRLRGCGCASEPTPPRIGSGCVCPDCASACRACLGFGFSVPPVRRAHQILSSVGTFVRRQVRARGAPPEFVRLVPAEIRVLLDKIEGEEEGHRIREWVDPGPPPRVYGVLVVEDRRRVRRRSGY